MNNSVPAHDRRIPLASCEARARRALERGALTRAAYQSLMGITAEVLLTEQHARMDEEADENREAAAATLSSIGTLRLAPGKQITPCDTPPISPRDDNMMMLSSSSPESLQVPGKFVNFNSNEAGTKLQLEDQSRKEQPVSHQVDSVSNPDDPNVRSEMARLEVMKWQGYSLSDRATRFRALEKSSASSSSNKAAEHCHGDNLLLDFVDICQKWFPPSSSSTAPKTRESDIVWQNRSVLSVPGASEGCQYELPTETDNELLLPPVSPPTEPKASDNELSLPPVSLPQHLPPISSPTRAEACQHQLPTKTNGSNNELLLPPVPLPHHLPPTSSSPTEPNSKECDRARWELRYEELVQYKLLNGNCNVPFRYLKNMSLGGWVQKQRDFKKKDKLAAARFRRLDAVGFSWILGETRRIPKINNDSIHSYDDLWYFRYDALVQFKKKKGHCNVPYRWKNDRQLGRWVQNQREYYKKKTLHRERCSRLEELGFTWSVRKRGHPPGRKNGAGSEDRKSAECIVRDC